MLFGNQIVLRIEPADTKNSLKIYKKKFNLTMFSCKCSIT